MFMYIHLDLDLNCLFFFFLWCSIVLLVGSNFDAAVKFVVCFNGMEELLVGLRVLVMFC